jgi:hypothetical protein
MSLNSSAMRSYCRCSIWRQHREKTISDLKHSASAAQPTKRNPLVRFQRHRPAPEDAPGDSTQTVRTFQQNLARSNEQLD